MVRASLEIGFVFLASAAAVWDATRMVRTWRRLKGDRVVTCTASGYPAAVHIHSLRAAFTTLVSPSPNIRIAACSRWAEGGVCDQGCIAEAVAPESTTQSIAARWYEKKKCVYCAKPISLDSFGHRAALRSSGGTTQEWSDVPAGQLLDALHTAAPVCWNCHVAETLRRDHPDLVTDRPWPKNADRRAV
jgi:hypothetical protein